MSSKKRDLIEDIYPLSPMQQGLLFHTLYAPGTGVYFEQWNCTIQGKLDLQAWKRAWQEVVNRNPILRTAFFWERRDEPFQVVSRHVALDWQEHDWRGLSSEEQRERLDAFLAEDRAKGFNLSRPPLTRQFLIQLEDDLYRFVWSYHQMLLDGWSRISVIREVSAYYDAYTRGQELSLKRTRPYRDYISWLQRQDLSKAEAFWRETLKGFTTPVSLKMRHAPDAAQGQGDGYIRRHLRLSRETTAALQTLARRRELTLNTLMQGAWALLLSRFSGRDDVLFGATVSGRPAELSGVENIIGLFINVLPVRVRVPPDATLSAWLKELQALHVEMRQYEYTPLVQVQGWSEVPRGVQMFESVMVFENYPGDALAADRDASVRLLNVDVFEKSNYPVMVEVEPGAELILTLRYYSQYLDPAMVERMLAGFQTLLENFVANPDAQLSSLSIVTEELSEQLSNSFNADLEDY
ncbi:MAG TPA: condensation domain-containing protein [Pyrinomonadaceae bacterium]|nr:condensation domain-containing protein [Pyrinomonadaceae bacterium]